jgi:glutathione reductase (NADPH)
MPDVPGSELIVSSNEMFHLERLPERVMVAGGGYIAVEFAGILNGLGCKVTQVHRGSLLLRGFDDDLRTHLVAEMRAKGIEIVFDVILTRVEAVGDGRRVTLSDGSVFEVDLVLAAIGRLPHTQDLGLENVGVQLDERGAIIVDELSRSKVPNIFAVGDVTDRMTLTPIALAEGQAVAELLFRQNPIKVDYQGVPTAVFSQPPLATVGMTEAEARRHCGEVDIYKTNFKPLRHTMTHSSERTFMKLVVERSSNRVVGCHMLGADAPEIIQSLAVALKAGATKAHFDATIGLHPSAAEEFVTMRTKSE